MCTHQRRRQTCLICRESSRPTDHVPVRTKSKQLASSPTLKAVHPTLPPQSLPTTTRTVTNTITRTVTHSMAPKLIDDDLGSRPLGSESSPPRRAAVKALNALRGGRKKASVPSLDDVPSIRRTVYKVAPIDIVSSPDSAENYPALSHTTALYQPPIALTSWLPDDELLMEPDSYPLMATILNLAPTPSWDLTESPKSQSVWSDTYPVPSRTLPKLREPWLLASVLDSVENTTSTMECTTVDEEGDTQSVDEVFSDGDTAIGSIELPPNHPFRFAQRGRSSVVKKRKFEDFMIDLTAETGHFGETSQPQKLRRRDLR